MSRPVYVALLFAQDSYQFGLDDVIAFFKQTNPNPNFIIEKYVIIRGNVASINNALEDFITKYPSGERATISGDTSVLLQITQFFGERGLNILNISTSSTLTTISEVPNALTYAPGNLYSVLVFFLIYTDYQMKQIKILYERNNVNEAFLANYRDLTIQQANLLNIPFTFDFLEVGKVDYGIAPNTAILVLAGNSSLANIFVTPAFLENIPEGCYFFLTDLNALVLDIFGLKPAFSCIPFPLNYTPTSQDVYDSLTPINKTAFRYSIFTLYDALFVLNTFTNSILPITKENYIGLDVYNQTQPAWGSNNLFNPVSNTIPFGNYSVMFTKNFIVEPDLPYYLRYYRGGHMVTSESVSVFITAGLRPFVTNLVYYDQNPYYRLFKKESLILTAFANDTTVFPPGVDDRAFIFGSTVEKKFIFKFNSEGFFQVLNRLLPKCGCLPQVNLRMSKKTITLHL